MRACIYTRRYLRILPSWCQIRDMCACVCKYMLMMCLLWHVPVYTFVIHHFIISRRERASYEMLFRDQYIHVFTYTRTHITNLNVYTFKYDDIFVSFSADVNDVTCVCMYVHTCIYIRKCKLTCRHTHERIHVECVHLQCDQGRGVIYLLACVAVCCSVLQCVAVCCSVLQCIAVSVR